MPAKTTRTAATAATTATTATTVRAARGRPAADQPVAAAVFATVTTSGPRGKLNLVALHEIPLLRRKLQLQAGDSVELLGQWPAHVDRIRARTAAALNDEYARLLGLYRFEKPDGREGEVTDLVMDLYGPAHQGRLVAVMRRQEEAWRTLADELGLDGEPSAEQLEALVALAEPEADYGGDGIPYEPAPRTH